MNIQIVIKCFLRFLSFSFYLIYEYLCDMNMIILFCIFLMSTISSVAQKWQIKIIHCSLLDVKKHHPNVTAIVNAANVYMRGGERKKSAYLYKFLFVSKNSKVVVLTEPFMRLLVLNYYRN